MDTLACHVDAKAVRYPYRYRDEDGGVMWNRVMGLPRSAKMDAMV